jgi:hypothetical protein
MPGRRIPEKLRRAVRARARGLCEYCKYPHATCYATIHGEHCVPDRLGGPTSLENLAWACPTCNAAKGDAQYGVDPLTRRDASLFNPRRDKWETHFRWSDDLLTLEPLTATGRVTVRRLRLNRETARVVRSLLIELCRHPATEGRD